jgi:hypothetical protein
MTVREQLAGQIAAIQAGTATVIRVNFTSPYRGNLTFHAGEITLECRPAVSSMPAIRGMQGRVNASAIGGAGAGHLLYAGSQSPREHGDPTASPIVVRLMYGERAWNSTGITAQPYPEGDFDALLAALEPGTVPPDVPPDRPGLL